MKKQNFKKLISVVLAFMMISSVFAMAIPVGAADEFPKQLANNEDVVVNGVTYRFDPLSSNTKSTAVVNPDNTITLTMKQGDLFWIPSVTIGNDSVLNMKVTRDSGTDQIACGLAYNIDAGTNGEWDESTDNLSVLNVQTNYRVRIGYGTVATMSGGSITAFTSKNFSSDVPDVAKNVYNSSGRWGQGKMQEMNLQLNEETTVVASFRDSESAEYASLSYVVAEKTNGEFEGPVGFAANWGESYFTVTINSFDITNAIVNGEKEDFSLSSSLTYKDTVGVLIPMRLAKTGLEFDGEYGFIDLAFTIDEVVTSDTEFVVKKNEEEIARKALSTFTPVDGLYEYSTYFTGIQATDVLTVCLEKDGTELERSSYKVEYGKSYNKYMTNPDPINSSKITSVIYSEDFSTPIVLQPGENIVNGHKWTYIKNSSDGSAVIKDGRLYFTGSNYDMILFDDINVDDKPYNMVYDVTYLNTPWDDDWSVWDCWFGGLFHLSDTADADGNKSAFVTSITPNDVYMLDGKFDANGVFTQADATSDHVTFENKPSTPEHNAVKGYNCYYWNSRAGSGLPVQVSTFFGASNKDSGGLGMDGYTAQGTHVVSANLPGAVPASGRKVGSVGFVCSESQVTVMVDNLSVAIESKNVTVDGETTKVPKTGEFDVALFQKDGKQIVYATVDGNLKYAGDLITANRLTQITTNQVALSTNKVVAVGETGLKWTSQISKADYEKLTSDSNISKVEVGTVVVLTDNAKNGMTVANATKNIAGTATLSGDNYVFEGVLDIDKDARDTSYSAVGYIKVTMTDGKEIVIYADYTERRHASALSDLVEFPDEPANDNGSDATTAPESTNTDSSDESTDGATEEKKGCGSSVFGAGAMLIMIVSLSACALIPKKSKE